jgi:hypothetical protein
MAKGERDSGRDIGPIGTGSRLVVGAFVAAVPVAAWGIGWWDIAAAVIAFPLIAAAAYAWVIVLRRAAASRLARVHHIWAGLVLLLVIGAATLVTFLTPADAVAIWVFFGGSMLVAAVKGYGGCEVLALPNAISGRRDQIGCILYGPIDAAEARHRG